MGPYLGGLLNGPTIEAADILTRLPDRLEQSAH
jgi:hypothetical protein